MKSIIKELYQNSRFIKTSETIKLIFGSYSEDWSIRYEVASDINTPPYILDKLSGDKDRDIRAVITQNPNSSISTLEKLNGDEDSSVRLWAAQNPAYIKYKKEKKSKLK